MEQQEIELFTSAPQDIVHNSICIHKRLLARRHCWKFSLQAFLAKTATLIRARLHVLLRRSSGSCCMRWQINSCAPLLNWHVKNQLAEFIARTKCQRHVVTVYRAIAIFLKEALFLSSNYSFLSLLFLNYTLEGIRFEYISGQINFLDANILHLK